MKYILVFILCWPPMSFGATSSWHHLKFEGLKSPDLALFLNHRYRSPSHQLLFENPAGAFSYMQIQRNMILEKSNDLPSLFIQALGRNGMGVRRNLVSDPLKKYDTETSRPDALSKAITEIYRRRGQSWAESDKSQFEKSARQLPQTLKDSITIFLLSSLAYDQWKAQSPLPKTEIVMKKWQEALLDLAHHSEKIDTPIPSLFREMAQKVDLQSLFIPLIDLTMAVSQLQKVLAEESVANTQFHVEASTPWGKLVLTSKNQNNTYKDSYFLVLDLNGDDTYLGLGGTSLKTPVSLIADLTGNDTYLANSDLKNQSPYVLDKSKKRRWSPGIASGLFGAAFLIDFSGDDSYRALTYGLASAVFGTSVLWDAKGNDIYECYSFCQSASFFGVGLLVDQAGTDRYEALHMAQAFALTMGASVLLDLGVGDDTYTARLEPLDFPSVVDPKINTSFAQGASLGFRGDFIDGHSWAGGVAILTDSGGGSNQFRAGFFSQGVSYWTGVGLLIGGEGSDQYFSHKYSLGISTHYGVGLFYEVGGDDIYEVKQELGIGVGHDFALGVFYDAKGNDKYSFANLAVGCASANGTGLFWDRLGSDQYQTSESDTLGCALDRVGQHSLRNRNWTVGFFLDTDGVNLVQHPDKARSGRKKQAQWESVTKATPQFSQKFFQGKGLFNQTRESFFPDGLSASDSQAF